MGDRVFIIAGEFAAELFTLLMPLVDPMEFKAFWPCFCCVAYRIAWMCVGDVGRLGRALAGDGDPITR